MKFTIGSDPEFFIEDFDKSILRSEDFTIGTKDVPELMEEGFYCQADNIMIELSLPAATDQINFVNNLNKGMDLVRDKINPYNLLISPNAEFISNGPERFKDKEVGCEPDLNAYTLSENPSVKYEGNDRFAGGHIHVGFVNVPNEKEIVKMVKAMDYVFMNMVCFQDHNQKRKEVYGTPGRFRFKPYGFEYRSLSNFWLQSNKQIKQVYENVDRVVNSYNDIVSDQAMDKVKQFFQLNLNIKERSLIRS